MRTPEKLKLPDTGREVALTPKRLRHLSAQAENLLLMHGIPEQVDCRTITDLSDLMHRLETVDDSVRLFHDEKTGALDLTITHVHYVPEQFTMIEIEPAERFRPEFSELLKRFIITVTYRHGIAEIRNNGYLEWAIDNHQEMLEIRKENPEEYEWDEEYEKDFENDAASLKEGSPEEMEITRLRGLPPLTGADLDSFSPAPDEKEMYELMQQGRRFLEEEFVLDDFRLYGDEEFPTECEDQAFTFDEQYNVVYRYGPVCDMIYDLISSEWESGVINEPLCETVAIPEEGEPAWRGTSIRDYMEYIETLASRLDRTN